MARTKELNDPPTIWRLPEVVRQVGLSRSSIYQLMLRRRFPRSQQLASTRSVGWRREDVLRWLDVGADEWQQIEAAREARDAFA